MLKAHKIFFLVFFLLFSGAAFLDYVNTHKGAAPTAVSSPSPTVPPAGKGSFALLQQQFDSLKSGIVKGFGKTSPSGQHTAAVTSTPRSSDNTSADAYFATAQCFFRQKDYKTAIVNGELALDLWIKNSAPESTVLQGREFLATCYYRSKDYQKAMAQYKILQKKRHENKSYHILGIEAGRAFEEQRVSLAREILNKGQKAYSEGSYHRAYEYAANAAERFEKLNRTDSWIASAYYLQARCCLKLGNNDQAVYYMRKAIHRDSANQTYKIALKKIPQPGTVAARPRDNSIYLSKGVYKNNPPPSCSRPPELPGASTAGYGTRNNSRSRSNYSRHSSSYGSGSASYSRNSSSYGSGSSSYTRNSSGYSPPPATYNSYGSGANSFTIMNSGNHYSNQSNSSRASVPGSFSPQVNIQAPDSYKGKSTPLPQNDYLEQQRQKQMQTIQNNNQQLINATTNKFMNAYPVPSYSTGGGSQAYPQR